MLARAFRAIYAEDPAVREAQAIALWGTFFLVWAPLMVAGEPLFKLLALRIPLDPVYAMFLSLAVYMLPARWLGGRLASGLLARKQQRLSAGTPHMLDRPLGLFMVGAITACIVGASLAYLWLKWTLVPLGGGAVYVLSGVPFKEWQTPLRRSIAGGVFFGFAISALIVGLWVIGH
jgi:hypothetical protein